MKPKILPLVFLAFVVLLSCDAIRSTSYAQEKNVGQRPMVEILGTQRLTFHSSILDRDYVLDVNVPRRYADTSREFPVLYLIDSQWDFPLVNAVYGEQYYDGFVPDIVIVGIRPAGNNPNYDSLRVRDLTPTRSQQAPQSGDGSRFLQSIKKEIIPFVESTYRVKKDDRALMGSSLGGLFTLYAMFTETAVFNRYILTSPATSWNNEELFTYEKEYAAHNTSLPVHLFMGHGALEPDTPEFQKLVDQIQSRHYTGLDLQTAELEGMGHSGGKSVGYPKGFQAVYARPVVDLAPAELDRCVGTYQINPQVSVKIVREDRRLVLVTPDGIRVPLVASSAREFYVKGFYFLMRMKSDQEGKIVGAEVEQYGGNYSVTKTQ